VTRLRTHWPLLLALLVGLVLRIALWDRLPRTGLIGDEAEYLASADWLALGRGFSWHTTYFWTRAPLYPLFLAAHIALFGRVLEPILITQTLLSLLNIGLIYGLTLLISAPAHSCTGAPARRLFALRPTLAAGIAAGIATLYLPFAAYTQLLLSETLFMTIFLSVMLVLGWWTQAQDARLRIGLLGAAGVLLGLATLTRGLALGFVPIVVLWAAWQIRRNRRYAQSTPSAQSADHAGWARPMLLQCAALLLGFGLMVAPWTLYASRAYGGLVVVDTTGAFNLAYGARAAYDGGRSDAPTRGFVLALLDPQLSAEQRTALLAPRETAAGTQDGACLYAHNDPRLLAALERPVTAISQAERQQLLIAEGQCLIAARPLAFVQKSLAELVDLFQINYTGAERLSQGFALGRLPPWYALALLLLDDLLYIIALPLALVGWAVVRTQRAVPPTLTPTPSLTFMPTQHAASLPVLIGLWLLFNLATAPLLFAINRFRVPLMPFVFVLAGIALAALLRGSWGKALRTRYGTACATLGALLWLVAATPYAYLEPRAPGAASEWASFFGPYPSSITATQLAIATHPGFLAEERLARALSSGDPAAARAALADPALPAYSRAIGAPLLDGLEGRPADGLDRLASQPERPLAAWQTSVIAGELFRHLGDREAARRELSPTLVDDQNPVAWAWQWLYPPPAPGDRISLADDDDLGYINGFYLGEFDPALGATLRWSGPTAAFRFPAAATGAPRDVCFNLAGAGWPIDLELPELSVSLDQERLGAIRLTRDLRETCLPLPARPAGTHYNIELHSPTFVPDALDLIGQQGPQAGQLRQLGAQIDWVEIR
jgi:4-amino-4-deoxy-L-arabinose transferase-like glycosyltransferase